jgi:hypothetical protein
MLIENSAGVADTIDGMSATIAAEYPGSLSSGHLQGCASRCKEKKQGRTILRSWAILQAEAAISGLDEQISRVVSSMFC